MGEKLFWFGLIIAWIIIVRRILKNNKDDDEGTQGYSGA